MKHLVSQSDTLRDKVSRKASRVTYSFNPHPTMHNPKVGELLILFLKAPLARVNNSPGVANRL